MCSEGFPFIVGVWGWTCVRLVLVVSSSSGRGCVVNFSPLGGAHALRHNPVLQSVKSGGSLARNARFGAPESQVIFAFCVTGAILWKRVNASALFFRGRRSTLWCGLSRCRCRRSIFWRGEGAVSTNRSGRDAQMWRYFKYRGRRSIWLVLRKVAEASQKSYFLSSVKMALEEKLARNRRFSSWKCGIWRKSRTKCSFWRFKLSRVRSFSRVAWQAQHFGSFVAWKVEEVSHEMLVLEACSLKSWGSLTRNARFGSLFLEKLRKPRTKRSFWKLLLWKLSEASRETLVLEASSVKFQGSLVRNDHFGSLLLEKLRKPRTKCSFWKLVAWKVAEASHEMPVLQACVVLCSTE